MWVCGFCFVVGVGGADVDVELSTNCPSSVIDVGVVIGDDDGVGAVGCGDGS